VPCRTSHWDIDPRYVLAEVGQPGVDTRVRGIRRGAGRDVEAGLPRAVADPAAAEHVDVVEVVEELLEVGVAVVDYRRLDALEDLAVDASRVVLALEQDWPSLTRPALPMGR
jgi:hypothetical protein